MSIYESKNRGKIMEKLSPSHTHTHTPLEDDGAYSTYLAPKDNYSWMRNCSMGPVNTKNSYCLRK